VPEVAKGIADWVAGVVPAALPDDVIHEAKRRLIDSVGVAFAAYDCPPGIAARALCRRTRADPGATAIGARTSSSPELAAFHNGVLIRYLDFNDTYLSLEPAHPSDNIAAALAAAELAGSSGRDLLAAIVLGYEIQCRFCDAASLRARGWDHVTYGALSTALLSGKLLGLSAERLRHALALAAIPNVALRQTRSGELSMWKGCAFANAARNGVFAALLAAEGMTGPAPIFEGELGLMKLVTRTPFDVPALGGEDGQPFMINETYIKFWPAEYHSQSAIDAALQLRPQIGDVRQIRSIDIHTFDAAVDIIGKDPEKWRPRTRETADHSLPYCTAVALMDGDVTDAQFEQSRFTEPAVVELTGKIKVHRDAELSKRYPRGIPNRLTVTLADGRQLIKEVEFPRGHARNPMTDGEVEHKFRTLVEPRYGKERADQILAACWGLEKLANADELIRLVD
jgi:2-methylcitrate dehydratase